MIDSNHDHSLPPFESQVLGGGRGGLYMIPDVDTGSGVSVSTLVTTVVRI